jgi:hypothetical protein
MTNRADIQISDAIEFAAAGTQGVELHDPLLGDLVRLADTLNVEHGISLTMGGSLLTGTLFSAFRFFEAQAATAAAGSVSGAADVEAARNYQRHMVEFYTARMHLYDPARLRSGTSRYVPLHIHLHNAKWVGNDGMFTGQSKLWRGRISTVDGFSVSQV